MLPEPLPGSLHMIVHNDAKRLFQKPGGYDGFGLRVQLDPGIQLAHRGCIDGARQPIEQGDDIGGALFQLGTVYDDCLVDRYVIEVIFECDQLVISNFRIGCINIGDLQGAGIDDAIGKIMIQPASVSLGQLLVSSQTRPAVGTIHEFIAETEHQLRVVFQV